MSSPTNARLALDWLDFRWINLVRWLKLRFNFRVKLSQLLRLEGTLRVG